MPQTILETSQHVVGLLENHLLPKSVKTRKGKINKKKLSYSFASSCTVNVCGIIDNCCFRFLELQIATEINKFTLGKMTLTKMTH